MPRFHHLNIEPLRISLVAAVVCIVCGLAGAAVPPVGKSLSELDHFLASREQYIDNRRDQIDSLKTHLQFLTRGDKEWFKAMDQISEAYTAFNTDSTLSYYGEAMSTAIEFGEDSLSTCFKIKLLANLPLTGYIVETVNTFNNIDTTGFSREMKELYLDNARQMFNYISAFYRSQPQQAEIWKEKELDAQWKLLEILPPSSPQYQYCQAEYLFRKGQYQKSREVSLNLLKHISPSSNLYARVCHNLADIAKIQGNENERIYYLTRSAITDIISATLEVTSLQELGVYLFNRDDLSHSYNYLSVAMENAVACHAPLRVLEISETLPLIEKAHSRQNSHSYHLLQYLLIAACLLLVLLAISLIFLKRQVNRKTTLQRRLEGANLTKEIYISQFLILCSSYIDKLNSFNLLVRRKIGAGKVDDLYKLSKSSRFMEEQSKEFYDVFDNAFLHIYPTFVTEVNKLLLPEYQFSLINGEHLNTDLRILALIRLGMDDSNRIGHMLNYSVNTIYSYRNRLRNRAINRSTFEADVMKIKSI